MSNSNTDTSFLAESDISLELAWKEIRDKNWNFGFLTLFQAIESFADKNYDINSLQDSVRGEVTIEKSSLGGDFEWLMTFQKDFRNIEYFSSGKEMKDKNRKATTLYKLSCFFKIIYNKDDNFLKNIGLLNSLRNKIVHNDTTNVVSKDNFIMILKIFAEIRTR